MNKKLRPVFWGLLISLINISSCQPIKSNNRFPNNLVIGVYGPLVIDLDGLGINENEELSAAIIPDSQFSFIVEENQVVINFQFPLEPGQKYQVEIKANGTTTTIPFSVRIPDLILIGNANTNPQIWKYSVTDKRLNQITDVNGKVLEVSPTINGQTIIFLLEKENGEREIWRTQTPGLDPELIFKCSDKQCSDISCSAQGDWVAFSAIDIDAHLIVLNPAGEIQFQLPYYASDIQFSPDGHLIVFLDNQKNEMVVFDLLSGEVLKFPSGKNLIGSIDDDSETILYGSLDFWGGFPITAVNELSVAKNETKQLFIGADNQIEYFNPTYALGGDLITLSIRDKQAGISTQLWLVDRSGVLVQKITQDYQYSHAALRWSPDMKYLAYQRFKIGESGSKPQIVVWDKDDNATIIAAEDAIQPHWLP